MLKKSPQEYLVCLALLVLAGAIWGLGFVAAKWTLIGIPPFWANALRFVVAGIVSLPLLIIFKSYQRKKIFLKNGLIASLLLFLGVTFQLLGLQYTTVAKSSFLTSFYAFFIPLILFSTGKKKLSIPYWFLLLLCLFGVSLLCNLELTHFNLGDFYTLLCALFFSFHILFLERISESIPNGFEFNCLQCGYMGLFSPILAYFVSGPLIFDMSSKNIELWAQGPLMGFLILGIFSSVIAFGIQVYAQKIIPSHIVGPLFLLESPFGALFGYIFLHETLTQLNLIGCFIILISVAIIPLTEYRKH